MPWIGFSAGGYLWSFHARPDDGHEHDDYQHPYFSFEYDKFIVTQRAPAEKGYLHKRVFGAICDPDGSTKARVKKLEAALTQVTRELDELLNVTSRAIDQCHGNFPSESKAIGRCYRRRSRCSY